MRVPFQAPLPLRADIWNLNNWKLTTALWQLFSRREKSKFSRAVERSDTPGLRDLPHIVSRQGIINRAPRWFLRKHLILHLFPGVSLRSTPRLNKDYPSGKQSTYPITSLKEISQNFLQKACNPASQSLYLWKTTHHIMKTPLPAILPAASITATKIRNHERYFWRN